jgi:hypothetical protein
MVMQVVLLIAQITQRKTLALLSSHLDLITCH